MSALPTPAPKPLSAALIDVKDVKVITGLAERTIWRFVASGKIPAPLKVGGRRLWRKRDIDLWIIDGCKPGR